MQENLFTRKEMAQAWEGFKPGQWSETIDVRDFIQQNYEPYYGDESFLAEATEDTLSIWRSMDKLIQEQVRSRTITVDLERFSGIDNFAPGYIDKDKELIVGLQTDEPMKRIMNPYGGFRMVKNALAAYNLEMDRNWKEALPSSERRTMTAFLTLTPPRCVLSARWDS